MTLYHTFKCITLYLYAVQYVIFTQKTNHTHILNSHFLFIWICSVPQCFQYVAHTGCFPMTKRDEADKAFTRVHGFSFEKVVVVCHEEERIEI